MQSSRFGGRQITGGDRWFEMSIFKQKSCTLLFFQIPGDDVFKKCRLLRHPIYSEIFQKKWTNQSKSEFSR